MFKAVRYINGLTNDPIVNRVVDKCWIKSDVNYNGLRKLNHINRPIPYITYIKMKTCSFKCKTDINIFLGHV